MTDYTPTTEQIRAVFIAGATNDEQGERRGEAFDRWLAAHDAEVREQGEPSESEIDAALFAYWGENAKVYGSRNGMRAALRAAGGAR